MVSYVRNTVRSAIFGKLMSLSLSNSMCTSAQALHTAYQTRQHEHRFTSGTFCSYALNVKKPFDTLCGALQKKDLQALQLETIQITLLLRFLYLYMQTNPCSKQLTLMSSSWSAALLVCFRQIVIYKKTVEPLRLVLRSFPHTVHRP